MNTHCPSTHARRKGLFKAILGARREERSQYGETVYLLEPNIKRSRGGLRDLQLLRWLGFACYGTTDPDAMQLMGTLGKDDQRTLRDATTNPRSSPQGRRHLGPTPIRLPVPILALSSIAIGHSS